MKIRPVSAARPTDAEVIGIVADRVGKDRSSGRQPPWRFLEGQGFSGELGQCVAAPGSDGSTALHVGLGPSGEVDTNTLRSATAVAARAAARVRSLTIDVAAMADGASGIDEDAALRAVAEGAALGAYRWAGYHSTSPKGGVRDIQLVVPSGRVGRSSRSAVAAGARTAAAVAFARDLVNEPGGALTAPEFGARVAMAASEGGVACTIHDEEAIRAIGFGGLLAVNQGSTVPPRFVELAYDPEGAEDDTPTVALVGKGVTFDSGGYSIKTNDGMATMKSDMGGGAAVAAALVACRDLDVPIRARAYIPLTDNMIGGDAQRVGDVITHYGGATTEVLNTDAEGRLLLADALAYVTDERDGHRPPDAVVDLATLTGACMVALGTRTAGLWSNDEDLADDLLAAATYAGERFWRMPLVEAERAGLESKVADRKNVAGRYGGAITAALFLRDFVGGGVPWAHLDIAGPAYNEGGDELEIPAGGTGFAVRTLLGLLGTWADERSDG